MSTILDALRKAAERRSGSPTETATSERTEPVANPAAPPRPLGTPEPPRVPEPSPSLPDWPTPADSVPSALGQTKEPIRGATIEEEPSASAPVSAETFSTGGREEPSLHDLSIPEDPSFLPADDDAASNRVKVVRAAVVVAIGVVLGLLVGRTFLPDSNPNEDDLLSNATLSKSAAKPAESQAAKVDAVPSDKPSDAPAAVPPSKSADEHPAGAEKTRGSRAEKQRRDAEKKDEASKAEKPAAKRDEPETVPPFAAAPRPSQARPKTSTPAQPTSNETAPESPKDQAAAATSGRQEAEAKPTPTRPASKQEGAGGALAALPPPTGAPPPRPSPGVVAPPPASPAALPLPPDDAPAFALLFVQWSSDPARRVASLRQVSGGTIYIVHEGDVVQGLRIAVIRPTGIEIQWRGQSFLLPASRH